ncbi:hypothetical protein L1887_61409 [Cichorium endivia]|nr:hypothetical protein L1887_61409 [Cichorium endivia]
MGDGGPRASAWSRGAGYLSFGARCNLRKMWLGREVTRMAIWLRESEVRSDQDLAQGVLSKVTSSPHAVSLSNHTAQPRFGLEPKN